jgi:phenylpropionate dioxygenase-like ring-hydroxylating dioxygenase large terminal subunit
MYINFWYPICTSAELDELNPQRVEMMNLRLVAFRAESGTAHVLADTCIHRGGSLSHGKTAGENVKCPYHGWEFNGAGICTFIPSMPDAKPPGRAKVDSYPVQEKYGIVFAFLGDLPTDERPPLYEIAEFGKEGWRPGVPVARTVRCYYERSIENGLDPWHNEFVHPSQGLPKINADTIKLTESHWGTHFIGSFGELQAKASAQNELESNPDELRAGSLYHGPNTLVTDIHFDSSRAFIQYGWEAPINQNYTRLFFINMRNCMMEPELDEQVKVINARVGDEDTEILEELWPIRTPDTTTKELLTPGDEMVMRYRNHLKEWDANGWRVDTRRLKDTHGDVAYAIPCPDRRTSGNWILDPVPTVKSE